MSSADADSSGSSPEAPSVATKPGSVAKRAKGSKRRKGKNAKVKRRNSVKYNDVPGKARRAPPATEKPYVSTGAHNLTRGNSSKSVKRSKSRSGGSSKRKPGVKRTNSRSRSKRGGSKKRGGAGLPKASSRALESLTRTGSGKSEADSESSDERGRSRAPRESKAGTRQKVDSVVLFHAAEAPSVRDGFECEIVGQSFKGGTLQRSLEWLIFNEHVALNVTNFLWCYHSIVTPVQIVQMLQAMFGCYRDDRDKLKVATFATNLFNTRFSGRPSAAGHAECVALIKKAEREMGAAHLLPEMRATAVFVQPPIPTFAYTPFRNQGTNVSMEQFFIFQNWKETQIAEQLTRIQSDLFRSIPVEHLLAFPPETSGAVHKLLVQNRKLYNWAIISLLHAPNTGQTATKFIKIMKTLAKLHNYNTLSVLSNALSPFRLARELPRLNLKKKVVMQLETWATLCSSSHNYSNFAVHLSKDQAAMLNKSMINFRKIKLLGALVAEIRQFQMLSYKFPVIPNISDYFAVAESIGTTIISGSTKKYVMELEDDHVGRTSHVVASQMQNIDNEQDTESEEEQQVVNPLFLGLSDRKDSESFKKLKALISPRSQVQQEAQVGVGPRGSVMTTQQNPMFAPGASELPQSMQKEVLERTLSGASVDTEEVQEAIHKSRDVAGLSPPPGDDKKKMSAVELTSLSLPPDTRTEIPTGLMAKLSPRRAGAPVTTTENPLRRNTGIREAAAELVKEMSSPRKKSNPEMNTEQLDEPSAAAVPTKADIPSPLKRGNSNLKNRRRQSVNRKNLVRKNANARKAAAADTDQKAEASDSSVSPRSATAASTAVASGGRKPSAGKGPTDGSKRRASKRAAKQRRGKLKGGTSKKAPPAKREQQEQEQEQEGSEHEEVDGQVEDETEPEIQVDTLPSDLVASAAGLSLFGTIAEDSVEEDSSGDEEKEEAVVSSKIALALGSPKVKPVKDSVPQLMEAALPILEPEEQEEEDEEETQPELESQEQEEDEGASDEPGDEPKSTEAPPLSLPPIALPPANVLESPVPQKPTKRPPPPPSSQQVPTAAAATTTATTTTTTTTTTDDGVQKPVLQWDSQDVARWLSGDLGLSEYTEAFQANHIQGASLVDLEDGDLRAVGVTKVGHRKRLLRALVTLRAQQGVLSLMEVMSPRMHQQQQQQQQQPAQSVAASVRESLGVTPLSLSGAASPADSPSASRPDTVRQSTSGELFVKVSFKGVLRLMRIPQDTDGEGDTIELRKDVDLEYAIFDANRTESLLKMDLR